MFVENKLGWKEGNETDLTQALSLFHVRYIEIL